MSASGAVVVRNTVGGDIPRLLEISRTIYAPRAAWREAELRSHLAVVPEGQLVAEQGGRVVGMAASLIVSWEDYRIRGSWREFTADGMLTNHDPGGRTLYGAGVMVDPGLQRAGVGSALYEARRALARRLALTRIRAGARLSRYHEWAARLSAAEYVERVVAGELEDPVLRFQLRQGFRVLAVVADYLPQDPASLGYAAVIEWLSLDGAPPR
ncbi:MAG TPA: GNAT family N-acetyltransferase, partial [Longimicrobiales bacterium]|nr:GNAT family N-acetyltransferase [Longimicrobiales bacterium]